MLGAAHALANPLTSAYGIVHGEAIALMLPHVIRQNGRNVAGWYHELLNSNGEIGRVASANQAPEALADFVAANSRRAGLASKLTECGVTRENLPKLAAEAAKQWTGKFNPVELSERDLLQLYESAL
jgi:alcohol dehydrogenase